LIELNIFVQLQIIDAMLKRIKAFLGIDESVFLLLGIVAFVFIFPAVDSKFMADTASILAYGVVLLSMFSIIKKNNGWVRYIVLIAILAIILLFFTDDKNITAVVFLVSAITFIIAVIILINDIAVAKDVNKNVVIQAVSGYLLIGVVSVLINTILLAYNPNAITISNDYHRFSSTIYYSFVTLTTIGYGEIVPVSVTARSISIMTGVMGQIYLTVIIAMIVGKYISSRKS
jgi:hypothetical protein